MFPHVGSRAPSSAAKGNRSRSNNQPKTFRGRTRPNLPLSSKYKTEMCHYLAEQGECPFGDQCTYAHTRTELRYIERHPKHKTLPCRDFSTVGFCPFGERCSFVHYKRNPDDILKSSTSAYQQSPAMTSFPSSSSQSWGSSSVALTVSPTPDPEEIHVSDHHNNNSNNFAGVSQLPSPWNEMGMHCEKVLPLAGNTAVGQDFLRVPGQLPPSLSGPCCALVSHSPHSCSSSGYSGAPSLSPLGSPSCPSTGSLSRTSSSSDLSDMGAANWPASQLQFGPEIMAPYLLRTSPNVTYENLDQSGAQHCISTSTQRLPIFKDISTRYDESSTFNIE